MKNSAPLSGMSTVAAIRSEAIGRGARAASIRRAGPVDRSDGSPSCGLTSDWKPSMLTTSAAARPPASRGLKTSLW
ncbi:MAG: hypothetical protein BIFFINMI_03946 [Phycisphaerae bacterium]|nr:hypothetical protein [Phycisphaerae bacterium]